MSKLFYFRASVMMFSAVLASGLTSCVNEEYDVSNINSEITLAGNGLTLPLGSTKQLTIKNVLKDMDMDMLRVQEDGSYAIGVKDELDLTSVLPDLGGMGHVDDIKVSSNMTIPMFKGNMNVDLGKFEVEVKDDFEFVVLQSSFASDAVTGVETIMFEDACLDISFAFSNLPSFAAGKEMSVDFNITLPEEMILDESDERVDGNVVRVSSVIKNGNLSVAPVKILAMDLSKYDLTEGEDLLGKVEVDGVFHVATTISSGSQGGTSDMKISVAVKNLSVEKMVAHVQYEIDGTEQHIAMDGFPDFMKDDSFVLDVAHPHIMIKAATNMGIPASGELMIIPVADGVAHKEDMIDVYLTLPKSESSDKTASVTYWLGDDSKLCPKGCTFVKADISKLIKKIPDEFLFKLSSSTDQVEDCVLEPAADYIFDIDYDFVLPLDFGKDLHMEMTDTITDLSGLFGQIFEKNSVKISGDVTSCLPIQLDLNIELLDAKGKVIKTETPVKQTIAACKADGTPSVSPLSLTVDVADGASVQNVDAMKVSFVVSAPNASGPVKEDDYVQANLKLALPEGITIDLDEI